MNTIINNNRNTIWQYLHFHRFTNIQKITLFFGMGPELIAQWERFIWSDLKCIAIYWEPLANKYIHSNVHYSIYWNVLKLWHNTHEKFKFNIYRVYVFERRFHGFKQQLSLLWTERLLIMIDSPQTEVLATAKWTVNFLQVLHEKFLFWDKDSHLIQGIQMTNLLSTTVTNRELFMDKFSNYRVDLLDYNISHHFE